MLTREVRHIQPLDEATILKIAAGEVIERPSCIVKELVENAIDAGSTRIEVQIKNGGMDQILIQDNGCGILESEMPLAVAPHATSKLKQLDDLDRIATLGFRGEALASVASVAQLNLYSKPNDQELGSHLRVKFGQHEFQKPHSMPTGTTVSVGELFLNVPARKKFLKTSSTEKQHIQKMIQRLALIHPEISWKFRSDEGLVFELPSARSLKERIQQLYGDSVSQRLLEVDSTFHSMKIRGLVSDRQLNFSRPQEIWLYINGRAVQDRTIQSAIMEGYRTAMMERRYPFALLSIEMDPSEVDVNIHPRKSEVRFQDSQTIYKNTSQSIRGVLHSQNTAPMADRTFQPLPYAAVPTSLFSPTTSSPIERYFAEQPASYPVETPRPEGIFSKLSYLGSIDNTYLVLSDQLSLYIVDQHAAHERVIFEKVRNRTAPIGIQNYLVPPLLEVTPDKHSLLQEKLGLFSDIGFTLEEFGERAYLVRSAPEFIKRSDPKPILQELLHDESISSKTKTWETLKDAFYSSVACHSAIRAHDAMGPAEIRKLLQDMDETHLSSYCPHGRPTFVRFSVGELEKLFRRS